SVIAIRQARRRLRVHHVDAAQEFPLGVAELGPAAVTRRHHRLRRRDIHAHQWGPVSGARALRKSNEADQKSETFAVRHEELQACDAAASVETPRPADESSALIDENE